VLLPGLVLLLGLACTPPAAGLRGATPRAAPAEAQRAEALPPLALLTDPFLQLPTPAGVRVVWFTDVPGTRHRVLLGGPGGDGVEAGAGREVPAATTRVVLYEDGDSEVALAPPPGTPPGAMWERPVWRHEAQVTGLAPGVRVPYRVRSEDGARTVDSDVFTLAPLPPPGAPLRLLLTSDHQGLPLTPVNLEWVERTVGRVDAVLLAGDLVGVPDRASEWFDAASGAAFFPSLQGRARVRTGPPGAERTWRGGRLLQHAPLLAAPGNHEVMGPRRPGLPLRAQHLRTVPREVDAKGWNTDAYEALLTLPTSGPGGERYWAATFGDVRILSLFAASAWRTPHAAGDGEERGRWEERAGHLPDPALWGHGQFPFEGLHAGSAQLRWLEEELAREETRAARLRVVLLHQPVHTLGENGAPPFTAPVPRVERDAGGRVTAVAYAYPRERDWLLRDVEPLLARGGVHLVLQGHSHVWSRFTSRAGVHFLETSQVGNTYGAFVDGRERPAAGPHDGDTVRQGDPGGLLPVVPSVAPARGRDGRPLPHVAEEGVTVFSVLETPSGTVTSYAVDTRAPGEGPRVLDVFRVR
jgi:hypothetical protein